ncbi:FeoA family protein [Halodesulfurarchaeum sp. HSR-GB]|uniref:FeoA family protein n=1 Tax=Halodesulfurarchaeum sp. HSR-GB TaxID=3074077 RepID=UPI00285D185A|nr:FeoA family protein [Halodesulfurarchaeum sp. HSR-GB]MDR5657724.1 FeoA family protein [Halodesulfurarchaeum sp. HSR-GB]
MNRKNITGKENGETRRRKRKRKRRRLNELGRKKRGRIKDIDDALREELGEMGIRSGKELVVQSKQPFNGPITITIGHSTTSLSQDHARRIYVATDDE